MIQKKLIRSDRNMFGSQSIDGNDTVEVKKNAEFVIFAFGKLFLVFFQNLYRFPLGHV